MFEPYIGQISIFAGNYAPKGWAFCDGRYLSIQENTPLFAVIGNTYGGNGVTNFALPDLRGKVALGMCSDKGGGKYSWGKKGGSQDVALTENQMPPHKHSATIMAIETNSSSIQSPEGAILARDISAGSEPYSHQNKPIILMSPDCIRHNAAGGGRPHDNIQPYISLNFIIALTGVFPIRN